MSERPSLSPFWQKWQWRAKAVGAWLRDHPIKTLIIALLWLGFVFLPQFVNGLWELFSDKPFVPSMFELMRTLQMPPFSANWITAPVGFLMLAAIVALLVMGRRTEGGGIKFHGTGTVSTPELDVHAECEKRITRLLESEEKHATRAKADENALKAFRKEYFVPLAVADNQKAEIGKYLEVVRVCTHDPKLDDPMPTIKWEIKLKNRSVHRVSLDSNVGPLFFEGHKLTEHKELLENKVMGLYPGLEGGIIFEQRLSPSEVKLLKDLPNGKFEFDKVMLYARLSSSDFEHIPPDRVVIFQRFRATLGRCSDERSQAVEELSAEMASLKMERDHLKAQRLTFEIDVKRTRMECRGYSDSGNTALIGAPVRLRCSKEGDSKLAVREFIAQLRCEGNETVFGEGKLINAYVDNNAKDMVNIEAGWTIDDPLTEFRVYDFLFEIGKKALGIVGRDLFVRITMNAIGQDSQHVDFLVNSWQDAIKSASTVTLRS